MTAFHIAQAVILPAMVGLAFYAVVQAIRAANASLLEMQS